MTVQISAAEARKLVLHSQGLHCAKPFGSRQGALLSAIEQLGYVQIDTISVLQRAHHHTLYNRVSTYQHSQLDQLMAEGQIFEYWSHAAAYLPMCDYRYSLVRKHAIASGEKHWHDKDHALSREVIKRIREEGPLQARDFEHQAKTTSAGWWDWKPAKKALEQLFMEGELMVVRRQGFQKVYELTERVLPAHIDRSMPSEEDFLSHLIVSYLRANGLGQPAEMAYLRKGINAKIAKRCREMLEDQQLIGLNCAGQHYYALTAATALLDNPISKGQLRFLSPFDNLLIQRKRTQQLFNFDYQIECYVPAAKRQYGYFSLPILWGSELVGRMDAKVARKTGLFSIVHLHLETKASSALWRDLCPALARFMTFNGGQQLELQRVSGLFGSDAELHNQCHGALKSYFGEPFSAS